MSIVSFFSSSIGRKVIMAVTGTLLFVFIIGHLLGNLLIFLGQDTFNEYAKTLKETPALLWGARIGLLTVVLIHVFDAISLKMRNLSARPDSYSRKNTVQASYASTTMMLSGSLILFFVVFHLFHFTLGCVQPELFSLKDSLGRHDVYTMVVSSFKQAPFALLYIVAILVLGRHLSHGLSSLFQSLGLKHPAYNPVIRQAGSIISWLVVLGYISIPIAALAGCLQ